MTLGQLAPTALRRQLVEGACALTVGPFVIRIRSPFPSVADYLASHYSAFPIPADEGCHFAVSVRAPRGLRRFVRRQALFSIEHAAPFNPVPVRLAPGMLEWGLNWCIGILVHNWICVHAGVVERNGGALLLPAVPGSGKSTLTAALAFSGWRLFSDEFALLHPVDGCVHPVPRSIALKGASIEVIARRYPAVRFGPYLEDHDGAVARHAAVPGDSVERMHEPASTRWIVTPKYQSGASTQLEPVPRARMLAFLADSSFNYNIVGTHGFDRLADVVNGAECFKLTYSDLDEALALFARMADRRQ